MIATITPNIAQRIPKMRPISQKRSFIPISQMKPSMENSQIRPGKAIERVAIQSITPLGAESSRVRDAPNVRKNKEKMSGNPIPAPAVKDNANAPAANTTPSTIPHQSLGSDFAIFCWALLVGLLLAGILDAPFGSLMLSTKLV